MNTRKRAQRGVTLVELIVSITVIALAASALMGVLGYLAGSGGTVILQTQAQSIANAYLAQALAKSFNDPDGVDGEAAFTAFDDVNDYNGLDHASAVDRFGNAAGNFRVRMTVGAGTLNGLNAAANVLRVDVRVDYAPGYFVEVSGYRTRYP
jgi:MSHA pilin protein MshD